jgi:monoterpene epsilon-lactone hydrolase
MSSQQKAELDALMRQLPLDFGGDLAEQRLLLEQLMTSIPLPADVTATPSAHGGVPAVDITVPGVRADRVLLYFHGGAYTMGSAQTAAGLAAGLAREAGAPAVSVDYRLAPEHPYPAALDDALAAYQGLLDEGFALGRIALAGESAGAGLAAATLVSIRDAGLPMPAAAVLMSPWADLTLSGTSITGKAAVDPVLTGSGLRRRAVDYAGGADPRTPAISPVFADLTGLPPLVIQAGTHEVLLDDAIRLAAAAAAADVSVTLDITAGVPHVFQGFASLLDEGAQALARGGAFVRSRLDA